MKFSEMTLKIARGWFWIGLVGLGFVAVFAVSHYVLGLPVHEGHSKRVASEVLIEGTLGVMAVGFSLLAFIGNCVLVRNKRTWKRSVPAEFHRRQNDDDLPL